MTDDNVHLFSYGTLQQPEVQLSSFGRLLSGRADEMPGFSQSVVEITDPAVIQASGKRFHPIVMPSQDAKESVKGMVFTISKDELLDADRYEVADYKRIQVTLASGTIAWVYIKA